MARDVHGPMLEASIRFRHSLAVGSQIGAGNQRGWLDCGTEGSWV